MVSSSHSPRCAAGWDQAALVLSAGGMFAAWQAGVWKTLEEWLRPSLVVGASAGALNGWAIASGCPAGELIGHWTDNSADSVRLRLLQPPWRGVFDFRLLESTVRRLCAAYRPKTAYGLVAVALPRLRARLFHGEGIAERHLLASCAIPGGFPPVWIDGGLYCDGGLISPLPVWAAARLGARKIIALNALPFMPSRPVRYFVRGVRLLAGTPPRPDNVEVLVLAPTPPLGSFRGAVFWDRENAARWIERGLEDGKTIPRPECFG